MNRRKDKMGKKPTPTSRTTMRLQDDILKAADHEAAIRGWSRTQLTEQLYAKFLKAQGHRIRLKKML